MRWNLRLAAARDIWKASELQRMLAGAGLVISAGKMSNLWSGRPVTVRRAALGAVRRIGQAGKLAADGLPVILTGRAHLACRVGRAGPGLRAAHAYTGQAFSSH